MVLRHGDGGLHRCRRIEKWDRSKCVRKTSIRVQAISLASRLPISSAQIVDFRVKVSATMGFVRFGCDESSFTAEDTSQYDV
jgi:hypothetical protein